MENVQTPALETDYRYSPTTNFTVRSPSGEDKLVALMDVIKSHLQKSGPGGGGPHLMHDMQRLADDLRFGQELEEIDGQRIPGICSSFVLPKVFLSHDKQIQNVYSPPRRWPQSLTAPVPLSPSNSLTAHNLPRNSSASTNIGIGVKPPVRFPAVIHRK